MKMSSREDVAKKIRGSGEWLFGYSYNAAAVKAIDILQDATDNICNYATLLDRLADLIDPTCQYLPCVCAAWSDGDDEEHEDTSLEALGNSENAYCTACGYEMMTGEEGWFDYERKEHGNRLIPRFSYCPNCGARVVNDASDAEA